MRARLFLPVFLALAVATWVVLSCGNGDNGNGVQPDTKRPAAVTTLSVDSVTASTVLLTWVATGDDSLSGKASAYDVRYSLVPTGSPTWWDSLTTVVPQSLVPKSAGEVESLLVADLLPATLYYFALVVVDDAGNSSGLSNVDSATTAEGPATPGSINGYVYASGGGALEGAIVKLYHWDGTDRDKADTTDAAGRFDLTNVAPAAYYLTITKSGYADGRDPASGSFSVDPGETEERGTIYLGGRPVLAIAPSALAFGSSETTRQFTISNQGTGTLSWEVTERETWIQTSPQSGTTTTEVDEITVTVDRAGLGAGDYSGFVVVTPAGGDPETLVVTMSVTESPFTTPDSTLIIPEGQTDVIQSYAPDGTIALGASSDYAQSVEVGDVIIGQDDDAAPNGFLRKVVSKSTQGGAVILETGPATLAEAFETMQVSETHPLRPSQIKSMRLLEGAALRKSKDDSTFEVELNCVLFDADGNSNTTNDQIRMVGDFNFTAALLAKIDIHWFTLRKFECALQTEKEVDLGLIASMQWEFGQELELDLAEFHLGAIPLGGVVWLVPTLTIEAHVHGDLTVTFETGIRYTEVVTSGFGYYQGSFYEVKESTKDFEFTPPTFTVTFDFETGASLNASCLLYGVAGPYIGAKAGFHFQSVLVTDPYSDRLNFDLEAILYAVVGIECDILNLDYNKHYQLYVHPIGEWVIPLPDDTPPAAVTNLAVGSPTNTSLTLTWTAPGDDGNTGTASQYDVRYATNSGTPWESMTQVTGEPAPKAAGQSESFTVTGLSPDTWYYFRLKTADEVPNWSGVSNQASGKTSTTPNTPPTARFAVTPLSGPTSTNFQSDASGSSDAQDATSVLQVRWDWENDGTYDTDWTTTKTAGHQYGTTGTKTIKLQVKDTGGLTDDTTRTVTVSGSGPIPPDMVSIPAGTFTMGSDPGEGSSEERPEHYPHVSAFAIGKYEVTNAEYAAALNWAIANGKAYWNGSNVVKSSGDATEYLRVSSSYCRIDRSGSSFVVESGYGNHPVVMVTWYGSAAFCNWRSEQESRTPCYNTSTWACDFSASGYRLPTEAEWEKAARGSSDERTYPWGNESPTCGRVNAYIGGYCVGTTAPVGSYETGRSPYGLYDMAGNVWEWCNDWYSSTYYSESPSTDPRGPGSSPYGFRVLRGGSWSAYYLRCSYRYYYYSPSSASIYVGFRVARSQ